MCQEVKTGCWGSLNKRKVKHNNNLGKMANGTAEEEIAL